MRRILHLLVNVIGLALPGGAAAYDAPMMPQQSLSGQMRRFPREFSETASSLSGLLIYAATGTGGGRATDEPLGRAAMIVGRCGDQSSGLL